MLPRFELEANARPDDEAARHHLNMTSSRITKIAQRLRGHHPSSGVEGRSVRWWVASSGGGQLSLP